MAVKAAIDLGTSETRIYTKDGGIVLCEPTVTATDETKQKLTVKAIGNEAKKLIGKTAENTRIVFPVFEGEIVNEKLCVDMLDGFLNKVKFNKGFSGSLLFSVPCGAENTLLKKINKVASKLGISQTFFIEAPICSAIGQNIPLSESSPCFVIDMGGGVTNIAGLSLDGVIAGVSVGLGGKNIDVWLIDYIADRYSLQIGLLTAERIKIQIGSLYENDTLSTVVNGRDLTTGRPRSIVLKAEDIISPIKKYYDKIFEIATAVLSKFPPEVSAEIRHSGVYVSGGTASIVGLEDYYSKKFGMQINVSEEPQTCVALGLGNLINNPALMKRVMINEE